MFIVTALFGPRRSVVGFFPDLALAVREAAFQASYNRVPKVYTKDRPEGAAERRRHEGGSILSGAQEVEYNKPPEPRKVKKPSLKRLAPWRDRHIAARQYAAQDKGDPFAYRRAMSLMFAGIAEPKYYEKGGRP